MVEMVATAGTLPVVQEMVGMVEIVDLVMEDMEGMVDTEGLAVVTVDMGEMLNNETPYYNTTIDCYYC